MSTPENNQPNTRRAEVLSPERHGTLRFHKANSFAFAADWLYVPVHHKEVSRLARQFPILFYPLPKGGAMPCMLLKSKGKSALNAQMNWQGSVLPDVMRLYPFGFSKQSDRTILAVYPDAPHFAGKGEKILTSKGKPTQRLNTIIKQLAPIQNAFDQTLPVMKELLSLNVLKPIMLTLSRPNGETERVTLLACADKDVLKDQTLSPAVRTLLYVHQQSCSRLFKMSVTESTDAEKTTEKPENLVPQPKKAKAKKAEKPEPSNVKDMIKQVCDQFGVSLDDLRSRKRSDDIKRAREALAADASACDCLPELAIHLERSVDTIKKWI